MRFDLIPADLRYAVRTLVSGRLFTVVAVTCLALGIATNTTMFSVFDAMFLRKLPFQDPDRLVAISGRNLETGRRAGLSLDDVRELAPAMQSVETLAAYSGRTATLTDSGGDAERISVQLVTANLLPTLGASPQRGRRFEATDDQPSAERVALVSDALWRRRYQHDEAVIGRTIRLDGVAYTIVGVMPPQFKFPRSSEVWIPMAGAVRSPSLIGRLAAGASIERANAELASHVLPEQRLRGVSQPARAAMARSYASTVIGGEERTITGALMGATTILLVIACVNLANLLLARGAGRRREIALRTALGASRGRIVRQLLTESLLLSLTATVVALPLAWYGIRWVHNAVPPSEPLGPYYVDWVLDLRTLLYAVAIALLTGVAFGLAPAFDAVGRRLLNPLRENAGAASGRVQRRTHSILIVAQIALALVLLAGASLFVRTYADLSRVTLGYDQSHLMTTRFYLAGPAYDAPEARFKAIDELAKRVTPATLPGAAAATVTDLVPLDDQGGADGAVQIDGQKFDEGKEPTVYYAGVAGQWPETFDLRIVDGRNFYEQELLGKTPVALINTTMARAFWPGQSAVGRRFRFADEDSNPWLSVIGVVPDIRTVKLDEGGVTPPTAILPHRFVSTRNYGIVVRTRAAPESVTPALRAAVRDVDPSIALFDVFPMGQVRWLSYWMYVMWGTMFGVFGIIALVIAAVGVYGVVFYTVAQRTREIGLRVALGARRTQVVGPMLRQAGLLSVAGIAIGLFGAYLITPLVGSLLLGVQPNDAASFATVSLMLAAIALMATWLPAWHASAVDPMVALRDS